LLDSNLDIVRAAIELMANLSHSENLTRFTKLNLETDTIIAIFNQNSKDLKIAFAVLTFLANTVHYEQVKARLLLEGDTRKVTFGNLLSLISCPSVTEDLAHRLLFVLDDLKDCDGGLKLKKALLEPVS
jgi:hypothetical protein